MTTTFRRIISGLTARRPQTVRLSTFYGPVAVGNFYVTEALDTSILNNYDTRKVIDTYTDLYVCLNFTVNGHQRCKGKLLLVVIDVIN